MNEITQKLDEMKTLKAMGFKLDSVLVYDMGFHRHVPVYVDQIDDDGTIWAVDSDGQDYEIGPSDYQNILSVEN